MNTPTHLPDAAARLLAELETRRVTIRVQQKLDEQGQWQPELQATGAIFSGDWQRLRRYHGPIVRHLQELGEVDDPFCEIPLEERRKLGHDLSESRMDAGQRAEKIRASDERALLSRQQARRLSRQEEADLDARSRWSEAQTRFLQKSYFDSDVWPHSALPKAEIERRKTAILEFLASVGEAWQWQQIRHRIRSLQLHGRLEKKSGN